MSDVGRLENANLGNRFNIFGLLPTASTTLQDVWAPGGVYQFPTVASTLSIVSTSASDAAAGVGARTVKIVGLNSNFDEITETITMNGLVPVLTTQQFIRVNDIYAATCGTYGKTLAGSHVGTITATHTASGQILRSMILQNGQAFGKSHSAIYTVPNGFRLYVFALWANTETDKLATVFFNQRPNPDVVAAPFVPMRVSFAMYRFLDIEQKPFQTPLLIPAKTDVWASCVLATGAGAIAVDAEVALVKVF